MNEVFHHVFGGQKQGQCDLGVTVKRELKQCCEEINLYRCI